MLEELQPFTFEEPNQEKTLQKLLNQGINIMRRMTIANVAGPALPHAHGISIYFPTESIHSSYRETLFAKNTTWLLFLDELIKNTGRISLNTLDLHERCEEHALVPQYDHHGNVIRNDHESITQKSTVLVSKPSEN